MYNSVEVSVRPLCSSRVTVKLSAGVPVSVGSQLKLAASFQGRNDRECRVLLCFIFLFLLLSMLFYFAGTCCCCMFALVFLYYLLLFFLSSHIFRPANTPVCFAEIALVCCCCWWWCCFYFDHQHNAQDVNPRPVSVAQPALIVLSPL